MNKKYEKIAVAVILSGIIIFALVNYENLDRNIHLMSRRIWDSTLEVTAESILSQNAKIMKKNFNLSNPNAMALEVKKFPKCKAVINKPTKMTFKIGGIDYYVKNSKIVGVNGVELKNETLELLTEKFALLDRVQLHMCQQTNLAYRQNPVNYEYIKYLQENYMKALTQIIHMSDLIKSAKLSKESDVVEGELKKIQPISIIQIDSAKLAIK